MSTSKVLCKFYQSGCCAYGENCRFSHEWTDAPSQVCRYYLAGNCSYGDNCRYEHVKPAWSTAGQPPPPSNYRPPSVPRPPMGPQGGPPQPPPRYGAQGSYQGQPGYQAGQQAGYQAQGGGYQRQGAYQGQAGQPPAGRTYVNAQGSLVHWPSGADEFGLLESNDPNPNWDDYMDPDEMDAWEAYKRQQEEDEWAGEGLEDFDDSVVDPADIPLCSEYASRGECRKGDDCPLIHGDKCEVCHKQALHPYNQQQAEEHKQECKKRAQARERRESSRHVECGICLERVLEKADPAERKFGLMACEHSFCLSCIRNWRATKDMDVDAALRTCPVCRTTTYFITPSAVWPETGEEKEAIFGRYRERVAAIDCRHFEFGEGSCPFGTSCFYKHAYRDGRLEEGPQLRRANDADGGVKVVAPVTLASFLETPQAQRLLRARPRRH